ncbi:MAG: FAD-binding protein [Planctomycetes bacterium]|nr:FAD-binding protein [Planctomycetota bacterium]
MVVPRCRASARVDLETTLRREIDGEVRFDRVSRLLYSTDASIYQIEPLGVVIPRTIEAVVRTVEIARDLGVPILPRGAGTSLAGQAIGRAIVLDLSKHIDRILEVNPAERWARVEPGVIQDHLNHAVAPHGLLFGPDTATSAQATLGGMIGNNSCGARSILYGKTVDHVLSLDVVLADGTRATFSRLPGEEAVARDSLHREVLATARENAGEIERRYPKIPRCSAGYNLDRMLRDPVNLAEIVAGSEGTLCVVVGAKLGLVPAPKAKGLAVLECASVDQAMEASVAALDTGPSAVELVDDMILSLAAKSLELSRRMSFLAGIPQAILIVEYYGEGPGDLSAKIDGLEAAVSGAGLAIPCRRALDPATQASVWKVRKAGLPLLLGYPGDAKPIAFVEDTAVHPRDLPRYIRRFREIVERHDTRAGFYAHASVGVIHIRPLIDLKTRSGIEKMESISRQVADLVREFGGTMNGEHGDGIAKSRYVAEFFGPRLLEGFRRVKRAFDPQGILNPGKIVESPSTTENLRLGAGYRTAFPRPRFDWSREGGFGRAVELCNGVGLCRKEEGGAMCPSYMATRDERDTTRARANALRAAISGRLPQGALLGEEVGEVMDLCLSCKACKAECPANVDMARLKSEWLAWRNEERGASLADRLLAAFPALARMGSLLAPVSNRLAPLALPFLGLDPSRRLAPFARETFDRWARRRPKPFSPDVVYFADTFANYQYPEIGRAAVFVLESLRESVAVAPRVCCQRPAISRGFLDQAARGGRRLVEALLPFAKAGLPIVFTEPSCHSAVADDLPALLATNEAREVARAATTFEEYVAARLDHPALRAARSPAARLVLHGHCHQRALVGLEPARRLLSGIPGVETVELIDSTCCGLAGAFGYERAHRDISLAIGEVRLFPRMRRLAPGELAIAPGTSCREQIRHGTGVLAVHPAVLVRRSLGRVEDPNAPVLGAAFSGDRSPRPLT